MAEILLFLLFLVHLRSALCEKPDDFSNSIQLESLGTFRSIREMNESSGETANPVSADQTAVLLVLEDKRYKEVTILENTF
ncbi:MAG: hypothetical protein DI609_08410 [Corynebacterium urealyticum]|uniref:Uncharacterized protein n=1 Tax=Corynebacterium urealyticum TaxID=43771 RepID=A0A2W5B0X1_9CORY|nr:MAG: hypothetical protein DI609_08410 [Corynebacterium urealyticum]